MQKSSLVPRPSSAPFSWLHTWPLNCPEKREKASSTSSNRSIMTHVDSVLVIMATCPHVK